ncbi:hypothetical protein G6O69_25010 [Pseudenhygromyxa sp. WMMC2535]|uniref:hypothetical protein n=1 Tax=Pseudenhygromyxa sp. WMMC2535 TaxID=2712867 RepID=UPI0015545DEB|nr:hypothetical protein [Pseudenhygromyxa sp. WMMC2535]NVB41124.1 hypothetical protein [Pseudenhygromyxa sp. WMMC2535]
MRSSLPAPALLAILTCAGAVGCAGASRQASALDARLDELEREEVRRQARLEDLGEAITSAEDKLALARAEARQAECRAARIVAEAEFAEQRARCGLELSRFEACAAKNDASTSKKALGGCGLGILAGVATGGALAPLALAGCAGGYLAGRATQGECGEAPTCHQSLQTEQQQLRVEVSRLSACERGDLELELDMATTPED